MVYLIGPRLHFEGRFIADVATGNNTPKNYLGGPPVQLFNFDGSGGWTIKDVKVSGAVYADGSDASGDPVVGVLLAQSGKARIVDLDPQQQLVSEIYGLRMELVEAIGEESLFAGAFDVTSFRDIWWSRGSGGGDFAASAFYQSELTGVRWGSNSLASSLLDELRAKSAADRLSMKFTLDGARLSASGAMAGRIVGTIGAAVDGEPLHHVRGRQLGLLTSQNCDMDPLDGPIWYFPAIVDTARGKLVADFGNSLETKTSGGEIDTTIQYEIGVSAAGQFTSLGTVPAQGGTWYQTTAGICEFPAGRALTPAELTLLAANPLVVVAAGNPARRVSFEDATGLYVTTDNHVFRLSSGEPAEATLYATRFGIPAPNVQIALVLDAGGFTRQFPGAVDSDLTFPASVVTDAQGVARFTMTAGLVDTPRGGLDGQICGIRWLFPQADPQLPIFTLDDFFSVLVWTNYHVPQVPTWNDHVEPILKQYGTLFPVMKNIPGGVDLAAYASVVQRKPRMLAVMGLPITDPGYMPVTRDLSPAKRQTIEAWLQTTGNNGEPNLGAPANPLPAGAVAPLPASKTTALKARGRPRLN